ncbi:hypothetical protein FRC12_023603 [Ceratobasidium sp. 428]|nr:hypothetical protein FRC12_023603 [Ceratobasidium sp. 428]
MFDWEPGSQSALRAAVPRANILLFDLRRLRITYSKLNYDGYATTTQRDMATDSEIFALTMSAPPTRAIRHQPPCSLLSPMRLALKPSAEQPDYKKLNIFTYYLTYSNFSFHWKPMAMLDAGSPHSAIRPKEFPGTPLFQATFNLIQYKLV